MQLSNPRPSPVGLRRSHAPRSTFSPVLAPCLGGLLIATLATTPALASGFAIFAHGSAAGGMGGAFVAQADDPSAVVYNIGGIALEEGRDAADQQVKEWSVTAGLAYSVLNESLYQGLPSGIGAGTAAEQRDLDEILPQVYSVLPLTDRIRIGIGLHTPFLLETNWAQPESFAGRFVASSANIIAYDLSVGAALQVTPNLGAGLGVIYRNAEIDLGYRLPVDDPVTGAPLDAAAIGVDGELTAGFGFFGGVAHRINPRLSWGLSYRSAVEVDVDAVGNLTQVFTGNPQLDDLVARTFPLGMDLASATTLEFPDELRVGAAFALTPYWLIEGDVTLTGWSNFDAVVFDFPGEPLLDKRIDVGLDDSTTLHFGVQYTTRTSTKFRFGFAVDESPQDAASVGAFLADFDQNVYTLGFARDWLDIAFLWFDRSQRLVTNQIDGLDGNYRSNAWMLSFSLSL